MSKNHPLFPLIGGMKLLTLFIKPEIQTMVIKIKQIDFNEDRTLTIQSYQPTEYFEKYFESKSDNIYTYVIPIDDVRRFELS